MIILHIKFDKLILLKFRHEFLTIIKKKTTRMHLFQKCNASSSFQKTRMNVVFTKVSNTERFLYNKMEHVQVQIWNGCVHEFGPPKMLRPDEFDTDKADAKTSSAHWKFNGFFLLLRRGRIFFLFYILEFVKIRRVWNRCFSSRVGCGKWQRYVRCFFTCLFFPRWIKLDISNIYYEIFRLNYSYYKCFFVNFIALKVLLFFIFYFR